MNCLLTATIFMIYPSLKHRQPCPFVQIFDLAMRTYAKLRGISQRNAQD